MELPPVELRGDWAELDALDFKDWQIKEFNGWAMAFDGGSKGFFFKSAKGERVDVVAANPAYWTAEDKEEKRQVYYVIVKTRFYLLKPESEEEKALLKILEAVKPQLTGKGREDPQILSKLIESIKDRKPLFPLK